MNGSYVDETVYAIPTSSSAPQANGSRNLDTFDKASFPPQERRYPFASGSIATAPTAKVTP